MWTTIKEASETLQMTQSAVRELMKAGRLNIGYVVPGEHRCEFFVSKKLLLEEAERLHGRGGT